MQAMFSKDRIVRISDPNKTILILLPSILALLVLFELVERDHSRAKTQTHQLVTATDREHRNLSCANKVTKVFEY